MSITPSLLIERQTSIQCSVELVRGQFPPFPVKGDSMYVSCHCFFIAVSLCLLKKKALTPEKWKKQTCEQMSADFRSSIR